MIRIPTRLAAAALLAAGSPAAARPVSLNGVVFSDELGGIEIVEGWGSGTPADPFVIVERVTNDGPAVLVIRGLTPQFGNRIRSNHYAGFALTKIAINDTGQLWPSFGMELQEHLGRDSTYGDGLSFGQEPGHQRVFSADRFGTMSIVDEPLDGVVFHDGLVLAGERVTIHLVITDNTPVGEFYLVQRREQTVAAAPAGAGALPVSADGAAGREWRRR